MTRARNDYWSWLGRVILLWFNQTSEHFVFTFGEFEPGSGRARQLHSTDERSPIQNGPTRWAITWDVLAFKLLGLSHSQIIVLSTRSLLGCDNSLRDVVGQETGRWEFTDWDPFCSYYTRCLELIYGSLGRWSYWLECWGLLWKDYLRGRHRRLLRDIFWKQEFILLYVLLRQLDCRFEHEIIKALFVLRMVDFGCNFTIAIIVVHHCTSVKDRAILLVLVLIATSANWVLTLVESTDQRLIFFHHLQLQVL